MKILIYLGHPAQYHFFKNIVKNLEKKNNVLYVIKSKDVLEELVSQDKTKYVNILPEGRRSTKIGLISGLVKREARLLKTSLSFRPDIMLGADPSVAHIGKLLNIPAFTVLEDDVNVISDLARITFPFSRHILAPDSCNCGKWEKKKISYSGYMKLAYLHPNQFKFHSRQNSDGKSVLIRLSNLEAFHDTGIKGFDDKILKDIIERLLSKEFNIMISSEKPLDSFYSKYILRIKAEEMHQVLCSSSLLISDSQSMTMEAAMLGIPSIRYSDFAGKIGVLEELEHKYQLTFGVKPGNYEKLYEVLEAIISTYDIQDVYRQRREKMLKDKIDVTAFVTWLIEHYPESLNTIEENPSFQKKFV